MLLKKIVLNLKEKFNKAKYERDLHKINILKKYRLLMTKNI